MPSRTITIPARLDQIKLLGKLVEQEAKVAGFDARTTYACQLAIGEACENIIIHGYRGESEGLITLTISVQPGEMMLELCDNAPPFNPARKPTLRELDVDNPPVGGLGLIIIHKVMDTVRYERTDTQNCLHLSKRITPSPQHRHAH